MMLGPSAALSLFRRHHISPHMRFKPAASASILQTPRETTAIRNLPAAAEHGSHNAVVHRLRVQPQGDGFAEVGCSCRCCVIQARSCQGTPARIEAYCATPAEGAVLGIWQCMSAMSEAMVSFDLTFHTRSLSCRAHLGSAPGNIATQSTFLRVRPRLYSTKARADCQDHII